VVAPLLLPVAAATAALTLKSDTQPLKIYVKKPRGTLYWGGAGLDGKYIALQLAALQARGIGNLSVGATNTATHYLPGRTKFAGTFVDAFRAGLVIRYEDDGEWVLTAGMDAKEGQFNMIGYSYGSLLAAQTANFYAGRGHVVDHLVLIASPIDLAFLHKLRSHRNIKNVTVIDLRAMGDKIYAGISQADLLQAIPVLGQQFSSGRAEGHFYYAQIITDSPRRWNVLAQSLYEAGLR
jgi:pimeloyl-ACP methyl ester carboxylesterase